MSDDSCVTCQARDDELKLTLAPRLIDSKRWFVEHVHPTSVPGWLVLVLQRHAGSLHELRRSEFKEFGMLAHRLSRAIHRATDSEKEYLVKFAERPGHEHVHFHLIPRASGMSPSLRGPAVFSQMGSRVEEAVSAEQMQAVVGSVMRQLRLQRMVSRGRYVVALAAVAVLVAAALRVGRGRPAGAPDPAPAPVELPVAAAPEVTTGVVPDPEPPRS